MKRITTPWYIYLILLLLAICLILPAFFPCTAERTLFAVLSNIGYGVVASLVVALLIDLSDTQRKNKQDKERMDSLTGEYRTAFEGLRNSVLEVAAFRFVDFDFPRSFSEWVEHILEPADTRCGETEDLLAYSLEDLIFQLGRIEAAARSLDSLLMNNLDLADNTEAYRIHIRNAISEAANVKKFLDNSHYKFAKKILLEKLVPSFLSFHQQYQEFFNNPYPKDGYGAPD